MKKNCKEVNVNIAVLDNRVKSVENFVEEINKNHLPHIYKKLDTIDIKLAKLNIWDKLKSIALIISSGIIGSLTTYIFLK